MRTNLKQVFMIVTTAALTTFAARAQPPSSVEPGAGQWRTWVISSGAAYRVAPPPDTAATRAELDWLRTATAQVENTRVAQQIKYWDAGAPVYRWMEMIESRITANEIVTAHPHRVLTYLALAMYDATVAAWESKYAYNRPRPSEIDPTLRTSVMVPRSPSYPSEHAAASAAAAEVLAYFVPGEADSFRRLAEEAARSRLYAGVQYPSDYYAGLELGRRVAEKVIERAANDAYTLVWTGSVPTGGPCTWRGSNPGGVTAPNWKTLLLIAPNEFRPGPPPDCQSPQMTAETTIVRDYQRSFIPNQRAFYWQSAEGRETWPFLFAEKWMFEDKLDRNPPRAARIYALLTAVQYDAYIASQDGKFAYWYVRPHQLDSGITPLFAVPNFPSYPSNHSVFSSARAEMLAYLFPDRAAQARVLGREASESRIWAGIHFPIDVESGWQLGQSVARKFIQWAEADGSR